MYTWKTAIYSPILVFNALYSPTFAVNSHLHMRIACRIADKPTPIPATAAPSSAPLPLLRQRKHFCFLLLHLSYNQACFF